MENLLLLGVPILKHIAVCVSLTFVFLEKLTDTTGSGLYSIYKSQNNINMYIHENPEKR